MPDYDFDCSTCVRVFTVSTSMAAAHLPQTCVQCGGIARRLWSAPAIRVAAAILDSSRGNSNPGPVAPNSLDDERTRIPGVIAFHLEDCKNTRIEGGTIQGIDRGIVMRDSDVSVNGTVFDNVRTAIEVLPSAKRRKRDRK